MLHSHLLKRRGQSTLEYIVLVTAIVVVLLIFLNPRGGKFTEYVNSALDQAGQGINDAASWIKTIPAKDAAAPADDAVEEDPVVEEPAG